jgi:hypothetical protein
VPTFLSGRQVTAPGISETVEFLRGIGLSVVPMPGVTGFLAGACGVLIRAGGLAYV